MSRDFSIALFYTLATALIAIGGFDIVFDDSYDACISNLSAMQFTDFSFQDQYYLSTLFFRDLYKLIQNNLPQVNVTATAYLLLNIGSLLYTLYVFLIFFKNRIHKVSLFILCGIISLLFLENIISITHTRFATIYCGVALTYLLFKKTNRKSEILHNIIFLTGFLHRPESGVGAIIIISAAYLLYTFKPFRLVKKLVFAVLCCVVFFATLYIHKPFTNRFEIKIEPDIEYALSTQRISPISEMKSEADSLRYEMATNGMFIDTSFVNIAFLRNISGQQFSFEPDKFSKACSNMWNLYLYNPVFIALFLSLFIFLISNRSYLLVFRLILFLVFIFALLTYLDYNVAVGQRHFYSLLIVIAFVSLQFYPKEIKHNNWLNGLLFTIVCFGTIITLKNTLSNQINIAQEVECIQDNMKKIEQRYRNKTMLMDINTIHLVDQKYTFFNQNYSANQYLLFDVSTYSILPRYLKYLSQICNCDASKANEVLQWASKNNVIFITTEHRKDLLRKYLKVHHNIESDFFYANHFSSFKKPECLQQTIYNDFQLNTLKIHE